MHDLLEIEVAYATPEAQCILIAKVASGTTIEAAIKMSGILEHFPEIDLTKQDIGVFSQPRQLSDLVQAGDRIEIYRPLLIDPKAARHLRVKKLGAKK